jgi:hypothetical protein
VKRGKWTRRLDIDLSSFEKDWYDYYNLPSSHPSIIDSWDNILPLTPNLTVICISSTDSSTELFEGFTRGLFESLAELENLQRVEWRAGQTNLQHLHTLSETCPRLRHLSIKLCTPLYRNHARAMTNLNISFPLLESLIVDYTSAYYHQSGTNTFRAWHLPKLSHFGLRMRGMDRWKDTVSQILQDTKGHIKSLDILEYEYPPPTSPRILPEDFIFSFPSLETLFITPYDIPQEEGDPNSSSVIPFTSLHTVGWRPKPCGVLFEPKTSDLFPFLSKYFSPRRFPNLSTILYPEDFPKSSSRRREGTSL